MHDNINKISQITSLKDIKTPDKNLTDRKVIEFLKLKI